MLSINGKKFMNLPEAVQWLLDNNALPFQCKANYVADTIIAKTDIINPSPAEIKVGSLVLFADGKVGTVSGITDNGFMVGSESTDLSDGVPHIIGISIDASQHLIFTMSKGDPIDAGLVRMVSGFSIDASQHLIVNYNDGTSEDLGAIFSGNITISGDLTATKLRQTTPNENPTLSLTNQVAGTTLTEIYNRCEVINGVLYFICNIAITNNSGNDIALTNDNLLFVSSNPSLSSPVRQNIVDIDGDSLDVNVTTRCLITQFEGYLAFDKTAVNASCAPCVCKLLHYYTNMQLWVSVRSGFTFQNGSTIYFTSRVALTVI